MKNSELMLASGNLGKAKEFNDLLAPLGIKLLTLKDYPDLKIPLETGLTFKENAHQKAQHIFAAVKKNTLADDSGLCVDFLKGGPGVNTARFAGAKANDKDRNEKLLELLKNVPQENRKAQFVCCICLFTLKEEVQYFWGTLEGYIAHEQRGESGFGYDPVFYLPEYEQTLAELGPQKNKISHRAKALKSLTSYLTDHYF